MCARDAQVLASDDIFISGGSIPSIPAIPGILPKGFPGASWPGKTVHCGDIGHGDGTCTDWGYGPLWTGKYKDYNTDDDTAKDPDR